MSEGAQIYLSQHGAPKAMIRKTPINKYMKRLDTLVLHGPWWLSAKRIPNPAPICFFLGFLTGGLREASGRGSKMDTWQWKPGHGNLAIWVRPREINNKYLSSSDEFLLDPTRENTSKKSFQQMEGHKD